MRFIIYILSSVVLFIGCQAQPEIVEITGYAQGTTYSIKYWSKQKTDKKALTIEISRELARLDKLISNYRDDSLIEIFNQNRVSQQAIPLDSEIIELLRIAKKIHRLSNGCYDPTIKPLFDAWGFKEDTFNQPSLEERQAILMTIGFNSITLGQQTITKANNDITIDLSAIGQGYSIRKLADILHKNELANYIIEIGGEMLVSGQKPKQKNWRIAVERPIPNNQSFSKVISTTGKKPIAVMTSGTYRHYFDHNGQRFSHILNPKTGKPVEHETVSVTVLLDDATRADAWSTALLCLGSELGLKVANENNLAASFFSLDKNNQLQEVRSGTMARKSEYWEVQ